MWITKLRLNNIKSYGTDTPEIRFVEGVNLIQGHNGAGKSTILESIGLALFGSSPYKLNQILREGCKSGEIAVSFISVHDGREYQVVRRLGSGGTTSVFDTETDRNLCTGIADTADFVRVHLGVQSDADLKALFEDAIGVPQGTMTAIFLENAKARKAKFDGLLRITDYEKVWDKLRDTGNYIDSLIQSNKEKLANLEGVLGDLPAVNDAIVTLTASLAAAQQELSQLEDELQQITEAVEIGQATKEQLDSLDKQLSEARFAVQRLSAQVQQAEKVVQESEVAAAVVADTAVAHEAYEAALALIEVLEEKRGELDRLKSEQSEVKTALSVGTTELANTQEKLAAVDAAAVELERLEPLVEQQEQLEAALSEAETAQALYTRLQEQLTQAEAERDDLAADVAVVRQLLDEAVLEAVDDLAHQSDLPDDLEGQLTALRKSVIKAEAAGERYVDSQKALQVAQQELGDFTEKFDQRIELQANLAALQVNIDSSAEQVQAWRGQITQAEAEQAKLVEYEQLLGEGDAVCPVCQRPMDEHAYADTMHHYDQERERLTLAIHAAQSELTAAKDQVEAFAHERVELEEKIDGLPGQAALDMAQSRFDDGQEEFAGREQSLQETLVSARGILDGLAVQIVAEQTRVAALSDSDEQIKQLKVDLAALDAPRRKHERAVEQVEARAALLAEEAEQQRAVDDWTAQLDALAQQLEAFESLEQQLIEARQLRDEHQPAYQQYLANEGVAGLLDERQADLALQQQQYTEAQTELAGLEQEHERVTAEFDAEAFEAQQARQLELKVEQATKIADIKNNEKNLEAQQARLAQLESAQLEREAGEREAECLETRLVAYQFIRANIRKAGPQITQQLVQLVAEHANQIFGEILDDHSLVLNWNADYSVSVLARGEERDFGLLSGGEQMAAAIALRLALLDHLGNVQFAFFDEPTTNLDDTRRTQLAERLSAIQSLKQLFVISHDDTFEQESYHVVQVSKVDGFSQVETR